MHDTQTQIRQLTQRMNREFEKPSVSAASKRAVQHYVREMQDDYQLTRRRDGYEEYLLQYVSRQQDAFETGDRGEPVCTCHNPECPLKRRRLPRTVRRADDVDSGIRAYRNDHRGDPVVLAEAQRAWGRAAGRVEATLQHCLTVLTNDLYADREPDAVLGELETRPPTVAEAEP